MLQVREIFEGELETEINYDFISLKRVNKIIKAMGTRFTYFITSVPDKLAVK